MFFATLDHTQIVVAFLGGLAIVAAASIPAYFTYKTHKSMTNVSESVGKKNGHGSIQDQLNIMWKMSELDDQERQAGRDRQQRIEETQNDLRKAIEEISTSVIENQKEIAETINRLDVKSEDDIELFRELRDQSSELYRLVAKLMTTLGNPADWAESGTTLIDYLRAWHHEQLNNETSSNLAGKVQHDLLEKVMGIIAEYEDKDKNLEASEDPQG